MFFDQAVVSCVLIHLGQVSETGCVSRTPGVIPDTIACSSVQSCSSFLLPKPCLPHAGVQSFECLTYIDESYLGKHVYISARRTVSGDNLLPVRKPEMSSWEEPEVTGKERRSKMHVF